MSDGLFTNDVPGIANILSNFQEFFFGVINDLKLCASYDMIKVVYYHSHLDICRNFFSYISKLDISMTSMTPVLMLLQN